MAYLVSLNSIMDNSSYIQIFIHDFASVPIKGTLAGLSEIVVSGLLYRTRKSVCFQDAW